MGTDYTRLKRQTLKALLEARGKIASNKNKATLIKELMEEDRAAMDARPETDREFELEFRSRIALYPSTPSMETHERVAADVHEYIMAIRGPQPQPLQVHPTPLSMPQGKPKIPYQAFKNFTDTEGEIDGYLQDFERLCQLHNIDPEDQVQILAGKLSGRAADAYRAVPNADIRDYQKVKQAILTRYAITSEAYRLQFRDLKKQDQDSHTEFAHRLHRAATGWLDATQATSREDVLQLLLLEQFFRRLPQEMQLWIRDRKPRTLPEAAKLADEHQDTRREQRPPPRVVAQQPYHRPAVTEPAHPRSGGGNSQYPRYQPRAHTRCHLCNQMGHIQKDCPRNRPRQTWPNQGYTPAPRAAVHCYQAAPALQPSTAIQMEEPLGTLHEVTPSKRHRTIDKTTDKLFTWRGDN